MKANPALLALAKAVRPDTAPEVAAPGAPTLAAQLRHECEAMARHALQHGLHVAPDTVARLVALLSSDERAGTDGASVAARMRDFAMIHARLSQVVAPATPQGIALLDRHRHTPHVIGLLGPVPLIRALTLAAIGFLCAVILSGLSAEVSEENLERGMLASSGTALLVNMLFLMCCAGLGASFATLFQAHRYIANSTYDPKFDASYGARLILGLIAGLILVEILPAHLFAGSSASGFGKPAMAMLGGFSASAVHRLLQRVVDSLETVVRGDPSAQVHAALESQRAYASSERMQVQNEHTQRLLTLQRTLDAGASIDTVRQQLAMLTRTALSGDGGAYLDEGAAPADSAAAPASSDAISASAATPR
ncbi:hypothetical protein [Burkholderia glumae]|uniref:Uncharacterized protein n=1 Tax=Burkholderia glumae TaxID=337 RepID=A0AAP9XXM6_BURGL|nr:hypothetical protein [Burkholderia glumae]ACR31412.1 Hypothetical protein bglu_2g10080 [Burkholderia glumae BGR1]AJY63520.1 hypothetical protein KS03_4910 [Burkholderia glumae LMG 2196 = ATCC 33617]KHJ61679.1 membrane protein [Burkholderia glumae]MCM2485429.1 hypothetical protein [Burkholderia glumae]MCM2495837.1 hypothetical protein [Burkholderia glumae]